MLELNCRISTAKITQFKPNYHNIIIKSLQFYIMIIYTQFRQHIDNYTNLEKHRCSLHIYVAINWNHYQDQSGDSDLLQSHTFNDKHWGAISGMQSHINIHICCAIHNLLPEMLRSVPYDQLDFCSMHSLHLLQRTWFPECAFESYSCHKVHFHKLSSGCVSRSYFCLAKQTILLTQHFRQKVSTYNLSEANYLGKCNCHQRAVLANWVS